jgi:hypothetical protein
MWVCRAVFTVGHLCFQPECASTHLVLLHAELALGRVDRLLQVVHQQAVVRALRSAGEWVSWAGRGERAGARGEGGQMHPFVRVGRSRSLAPVVVVAQLLVQGGGGRRLHSAEAGKRRRTFRPMIFKSKEPLVKEQVTWSLTDPTPSMPSMTYTVTFSEL